MKSILLTVAEVVSWRLNDCSHEIGLQLVGLRSLLVRGSITATLLLTWMVGSACAVEYGLPSGTVSGSVGVNIAYNHEDWDLIQSTGVKFVRMNLYWSECEKTLGNIDFAASGDDAMVAATQQRGIRVLYDLYWGNPGLYGPTDFGSATWRQNYVNFAAAAADRFKGKGIIYELWNEPNLSSDGSQIVENYMAFVREATTAIRAADPSSTIIAPAVGQLGATGPAWLTSCFQQGLLDYVDAISLHPYADPPSTAPESVVGRYANIRGLMQTHGGKTLPIVSGEWGYSTYAVAGNEEVQGNYLARSTLVNLSQDIPLSIWFEFRDRSHTGDLWENNYGMIAHNDTTGEYIGPRPAYYRMQELTQALRGTTFSQRRTDGSGMSSDDWLLEFTWSTGETTLAAWTAGNSHYVYNQDWGLLHLTSTPFYVNPVPVPEPGSLVLLTIAGMSILGYACKKSDNGSQPQGRGEK